MDEELEKEIKDLWMNHRLAVLGVIIGVLLGFFVLVFGFFNTLFVTLCAVLGLLIGKRLDNGEDVLGKVESFFFKQFKGR